jgi:threonine synthase
MQYYSLNGQSPTVDFKTATILGQAPDGGLYFPETLPQWEPGFVKGIETMADADIAFHIIHPYVCGCIADAELHLIVQETIAFPIPLWQVHADVYALELFHGPTLAFKDVGARFMSRCLGHFVQGTDRQVVVLVATSGDTGGAVANGFYGVPGVSVVILYPSGRVSDVQEKQLTTLGSNVHALEIAGSFDDCQQMVKRSFTDKDITDKLFLTSANSINVARWLPQQFYYALAYKQWPDKDRPPVISVPSGNFGNICAGMLAHHSGLPVQHFIAACNANRVVPNYLDTAQYHPQQSIATLSNAMDVGNPSNFVRILELFHHEWATLKNKLSSVSVSDAETVAAMRLLHEQHGYFADPHGAVGYAALAQYLQRHPGEKGLFLETAHPVKFLDTVESGTGVRVPLPEGIEALLQRPKQSTKLPVDYEKVKEYLMGMGCS